METGAWWVDPVDTAGEAVCWVGTAEAMEAAAMAVVWADGRAAAASGRALLGGVESPVGETMERAAGLLAAERGSRAGVGRQCT